MTDAATVRPPDPPFARPPDPRLAVALGAALLAQSCLGLIWAGGAAERIGQLERRAVNIAVVVERTARLEEQMTAARDALARIEAKLDRDARSPTRED